MTSYLPNTRPDDVGSVLYSSTSEGMAVTSTRAQKGLSSSDTVSSALITDVKAKSPLQGRPMLPVSKPTLPPNDIMLIAKAFCEAYTAMRSSIKAGTEDYTQLQELDQTQTKALLASATSAISKLKDAEKKSAELEHIESILNEFEKFFGKSMIVIAIVLLFATVGAAIATGAAALVALPEEAELFEMADVGAEAGVDAGADLVEDAVADASAGAGEASSAGATAGAVRCYNKLI